jgi:hypothetical protein
MNAGKPVELRGTGLAYNGMTSRSRVGEQVIDGKGAEVGNVLAEKVTARS